MSEFKQVFLVDGEMLQYFLPTSHYWEGIAMLLLLTSTLELRCWLRANINDNKSQCGFFSHRFSHWFSVVVVKWH